MINDITLFRRVSLEIHAVFIECHLGQRKSTWIQLVVLLYVITCDIEKLRYIYNQYLPL